MTCTECSHCEVERDTGLELPVVLIEALVGYGVGVPAYAPSCGLSANYAVLGVGYGHLLAEDESTPVSAGRFGVFVRDPHARTWRKIAEVEGEAAWFGASIAIGDGMVVVGGCGGLVNGRVIDAASMYECGGAEVVLLQGLRFDR